MDGESNLKTLLTRTGVPPPLDPNGNTPLLWASREGHHTLVKKLIEEYHQPVNRQNFDGETPLSVAILGNYFIIVKYLVECGADINLPNSRSETPIHLAAAFGFLEIAQFLVEMGCFLEAQDECGDTPLHFAVREEKADIVRLFLSAGSDPCHLNYDEETPLMLAEMVGSPSIKEAFLMDDEGNSGTDFTMISDHQNPRWNVTPPPKSGFGLISPPISPKPYISTSSPTGKKIPVLPGSGVHSLKPSGLSGGLDNSGSSVWQGENSTSSFPKRLTPNNNLPYGNLTGRQMINV